MGQDAKRLRRYRYLTWGVLGVGVLALAFVLLVGALPIQIGYLVGLIVLTAIAVLAVEVVVRRASSRAT